ncbi:MAG: LysM peptidoglycan-binding domain-containing protein [Ideonella sp.]|nr:LysM peptidoglycan-binding domain-containing protein [Ideonella sp.]
MLVASGSTWALGLGRLNVQSALGEALRAEIDITNLTPEEDSTLKVRVAPPDSYRAAGVEYNSVLQSAQVSIARRADGRAYLRLQSDRAVQEPFVDVILELTWASGRLVREYTLLLDPPQSRVAPPAMAAAPVSPSISATPQPATSMPAPTPPAVAAAPIAPQAAAPAPRPAPRPAAPSTARSQAASQGPTAAGEYKVREGDTLYRIAKSNQRQGVSLDQMLVALFRSNSDAFIGDNMNRLKAGAVLSVPSSDDAKAITAADAREVIRAQSADFSAYRRRLAGNVPTTKADEGRQAKGKVQASVDETKAAAAPTPDKLTLSQGAVKPTSPEAKASKDAEKKDAATRVAELTRNVEELKKLQEGGKAAAPAGTPTAPPAAEAKPAPAAPVAPPTPAQTPAAPAPTPAPVAQAPATEPPKTAEPATPAVPVPPVASVPAAPPAVATPTPPQAEEPGLLASLMDHPLAIPGGIGLVVLLAGLGLYRMRGRFRKDNGETSFLESRLQPDSFFGASGGQRVDTRDAGASGASSSMSYSLSQLDAIGDVDPVAEADVYLAYGRDLQAEEILKEAMRGNPDRLAIRTKLLEVYAKRRDTKGFELLATQLYALTKGEGDDWAKAQDLGRQIDPENPLYQPGGAPAATVVGDGGRVIEPLGASTMPQSIMPHTSGFATSSGVDTLSPETRGGQTIPPDLDLDLDLGTNAQPATLAAAPAAAPVASLEMGSISLDLGAPSGAAPLSSSSGPESKPALDFGDFTLPAQPSSLGALDENDPLARKLELAEEFRQIGDMEGARDLLEEVVAKAGGALKTKAQSMLDGLA